MRHFYIENDCANERQNFYKYEIQKKICVKRYDLMCFAEELTTSQFEELAKQMPKAPSIIANFVYIRPYKHEQHMASYLLPKPIPVHDENVMLHLYHLINASMQDLLHEAVCKHDFGLRLVAFHVDDFKMNHPYFIETIPTFRNTWGVQKATMTAIVDSFEGIPLKRIPAELRRIWIDNMKKGLNSRNPKPVHVKEAQDHLEVTWHFTGLEETTDLLSSVFWQPGHRDMTPTEFTRYYNLHEKADFSSEFDQLQTNDGVGDKDV